MLPRFQCGNILCSGYYVLDEHDDEHCIKCRNVNRSQEVRRLHRKSTLEQELKKAGLELDVDSEQCSNYIQIGNDDVYFIVEDLCLDPHFFTEMAELENTSPSTLFYRIGKH